jgi:DNA-binding response OmpR family regulator
MNHNRRPSRILIVDDEEDILFAFKRALCEPGMKIDIAGNLCSAVSLLSKHSYSAIVTDLRLGGADKLEGLMVVCMAKNSHPTTKVIVITAYGTTDIRQKTFNAGTDIYIEKPVSPREVSKILKSMGVC